MCRLSLHWTRRPVGPDADFISDTPQEVSEVNEENASLERKNHLLQKQMATDLDIRARTPRVVDTAEAEMWQRKYTEQLQESVNQRRSSEYVETTLETVAELH